MNIFNERHEKRRYYTGALYILVFLMITGNMISNDKIRIFGIVLSAYRVVLPVLFVFLFSLRIRQGKFGRLCSHHMLLVYLCFMAFWIIWGLGLLFISPYADFREGMKELLSLSLGLISIYCFWELCDSENKLEKVFHFVRVICIILSIWAFVEILTGFFLPFSKYCWLDIVDRKDWYAMVLQGIKDDSLCPATTVFHNTNDFSSFLAICLPLFYVSEKNTRRKNIKHGMGFLLIVFVIGMNDSNIALMGIIASVVFYFIISNKKYAGGLFALLLALLSFGNKWLFSALILIKSNLPIEVPLAAKKYGSCMELIKRSEMFNLDEVVQEQTVNAIGGSTNSLVYRWNITLSSLRMFFKSKCMGIGPAGFSNYIKANEKNSRLLNPHNWWMEILSQYGIFVFLLYVILMGTIFFLVCKIYKKTKNHFIAVYLCMCITFCFACIAPSSYLDYTYQWILPAIGICIIGFWISKEKRIY